MKACNHEELFYANQCMDGLYTSVKDGTFSHLQRGMYLISTDQYWKLCACMRVSDSDSLLCLSRMTWSASHTMIRK